MTKDTLGYLESHVRLRYVQRYLMSSTRWLRELRNMKDWMNVAGIRQFKPICHGTNFLEDFIRSKELERQHVIGSITY
jgi:hypothetical protein